MNSNNSACANDRCEHLKAKARLTGSKLLEAWANKVGTPTTDGLKGAVRTSDEKRAMEILDGLRSENRYYRVPISILDLAARRNLDNFLSYVFQVDAFERTIAEEKVFPEKKATAEKKVGRALPVRPPPKMTEPEVQKPPVVASPVASPQRVPETQDSNWEKEECNGEDCIGCRLRQILISEKPQTDGDYFRIFKVPLTATVESPRPSSSESENPLRRLALELGKLQKELNKIQSNNGL